jgi:hypothetical protein
MGSGCIDPHFLYLGTSWRWVVKLRPGHFTPGERARGTHWIGGWVDLGAGLDDLENNIFDHTGTRTPTPSVVQPVASRYTDYAIPAHSCEYIE